MKTRLSWKSSQRNSQVKSSRCQKIWSLTVGHHLRHFAFIVLLVLELAVQYRPGSILKPYVGFVAFLAWLLSIPGADKTSRRLALLLVAIGSVLFAANKTSLVTAIDSFGQNTNVLMIMVLVPLLGIVIDLGGYRQALEEVSRSVRQPVSLFFLAAFLVYAIGSVLLNAAIALVWAVLKPIVEKTGKDPGEFLVASLPRGYDASLLWTPSSPAMAVALGITGASWPEVFLPGVALSAVILVCAALVEIGGPLLGRVEETFDMSLPTPNPSNRSRRDILILTVGLLSFIGAIVLAQSIGLSIYQALVPCIAITLFLWLSALGKVRDGLRLVMEHFTRKIPDMSSQFLLMTTAGFIGVAIRVAAGDGFATLAGRMSSLGATGFALVVSFLVWGISVVGVHPLIGMTIVYSLVLPASGGDSAPYVALVLLLGSALGFSVSPVSATILVTSACAGCNSIEVGIKKHWKFALVSWLAASLVLSLFSK